MNKQRLALVVLLWMWARPSPAATLRVWPAEFVVQNIPVGKLCDLHAAQGVMLNILNGDERAHTYRVSTRAPTPGTWQEGYAAIPDPAWFAFEPELVSVPAGATGQSKMFVRIPRDARYYNQHWAVSLAVEAVPEPGSMVALAAYPRAYLESEAKADVKERPLARTGLVPSVVSVGESHQGPARGEFRVFNNGSKAHSYTLRVFAGAAKIAPSPGRGWVHNIAWLSVRPQSVTIPAGQSRKVVVEARVPEAYTHTMPAWEAVILVEPEGPGHTGANFVRVQPKSRMGMQP